MSDRRDAFLTCPACGGAMARWRTAATGYGGDEGGDDIVEECGSCHGVWLDWWGGEASGIARTVPSRPRPDSAGQPGGACPRDGTTLIERPYLDAGPVVERCPTCLGLFARRALIAQLAAYHEHIPVDPPEPIVWVSFLSRFWHAFVK